MRGPIIEMGEWTTYVLPEVNLSTADWNLVEALSAGDQGRLHVEAHRTGVRIQARSWVGVVRFENFEVRVVPKLAGGNICLVEMIEIATGLDALRRTAGERTLNTDGAHLFDLIALLFADACEVLVRQGIVADYTEREDNLAVLRGRLLVDRQILCRFGQVDRLECRFDELDQDIPENKILALALGACAKRVEHATVRRRVRRLHVLFDEVCSTEGADPLALLDTMTYHRMNEHYREAHEFARVVLEGLGVDNVLQGGEAKSFAFLLDMSRLFERFIWRLVQRLFSRRPLQIHYQRASRSILWDVGSNRPYTHIVPDIIVESTCRPHVRLPIDVKYKLYEGRRVATADIYQAFLYAYAYGENPRPRRALLIHPASSERIAPLVRLAVRDAQRLAGAEIGVLSLPVPLLLGNSSPTPVLT